jgi:hypothetical protein
VELADSLAEEALAPMTFARNNAQANTRNLKAMSEFKRDVFRRVVTITSNAPVRRL